MGRVSHALRRCSRGSLEDPRGGGLSPLPSVRARLLSEALQKPRGRASTGALITSVRVYVALWIRRAFFRAGLAVAWAKTASRINSALARSDR